MNSVKCISRHQVQCHKENPWWLCSLFHWGPLYDTLHKWSRVLCKPYQVRLWWNTLRIWCKLCIPLLHHPLSDIWSSQNLPTSWKQRFNNILHNVFKLGGFCCWTLPKEFWQNMKPFGENGYRQPYISPSKVQLWAYAWPPNSTSKACMHFSVVKICSCFHQICPNVKCICFWPHGNY